MGPRVCFERRLSQPLSAALTLLLFAVIARADADAVDALAATRPIVDARLRFERVSQDSIEDPAEAVTLRARIGFETGKAWNTTLLAEGEFVWPLSSGYDSTTNGKTMRPVVADPESHELNRLQLTNTALPNTVATLGRQRILLDDQRFVGNVGWRQNEQTFDSLRVVNRSLKDLTVDVAYVTQVNRVFGQESPQGRYEGDTWLANISYALRAGKLTGFGYRIGFDPDPAAPAAVRDSSRTFGVRFAGEREFGPAKIAYVGSGARQRQNADNPLSFQLDYMLGELTATYRQLSLGAGIEVLEGDGTKGFTTPLATLHKFQGWADKFTTTPANGIDDRFVSAGMTVDKAGLLDSLAVTAAYHRYEAERGALDYGSEVNVSVQAKRQRWNGAIKYADYDADRWLTDTAKWWLQLEYAW